MRRLVLIGLFAALTGAAVPAWAQDSGLSVSGKGIAGGILLGGELSAFSFGLLQLEPDWLFASSIVAGATLGGLAGLSVERNAEQSASDVLLVAGMGLLIPVVVWVGDMRSPKPSSEARLGLMPRLGGGGERGLELALRAPWP